MQDNPVSVNIIECTAVFVPPSVVISNDSVNKSKTSSLDIPMTTRHVSPLYARKLKPEPLYERRQCLNHRFASPRLLHLSPCRGNRPSSRNSLTSRLSSSHNSLITQFQDDSSFITQAISHDTLSAKTSDITDMYNVPFDSDIYAVPIDMVRPSHSNVRSKCKKPPRTNKKRGKSTPQNTATSHVQSDKNHKPKETTTRHKDSKNKRHSLPSSSCKKNISDSETDSLHLTLREMRKYLHTLYSSSSDSECRNTINKKNNIIIPNVEIHVRPTKDAKINASKENEVCVAVEANNNHKKPNKNSFGMNVKNKKHKEVPKDVIEIDKSDKSVKKVGNQKKMSPVRILSLNLKQSFCNLFRWRRTGVDRESGGEVERVEGRESPPAAVRRALPPLPPAPAPHSSRRLNDDDAVMDFATSIQRVKDVSVFYLNL